jgi:hypothetical protein
VREDADAVVGFDVLRTLRVLMGWGRRLRRLPNAEVAEASGEVVDDVTEFAVRDVGVVTLGRGRDDVRCQRAVVDAALVPLGGLVDVFGGRPLEQLRDGLGVRRLVLVLSLGVAPIHACHSPARLLRYRKTPRTFILVSPFAL